MRVEAINWLERMIEMTGGVEANTTVMTSRSSVPPGLDDSAPDDLLASALRGNLVYGQVPQ